MLHRCTWDSSGVARVQRLGGQSWSVGSPLPPFPYSPLSPFCPFSPLPPFWHFFPSFSFPHLSFSKSAKGLGEHCKLPQRGLGRSPGRHSIFATFWDQKTFWLQWFWFFLHRSKYPSESRSIVLVAILPIHQLWLFLIRFVLISGSILERVGGGSCPRLPPPSPWRRHCETVSECKMLSLIKHK